MTTTATNTLGTALTLTVKTLGTSCAAFDGTSRRSRRPPSTAPRSAARRRVPRPATAPWPALSNEVLCFRVNLPLATGDTLQGITSAVTFTFAAEQTANNP